MKVFYTCSYYGKGKYQKYYDLVLAAIEKTGAEVISPEKGNYKKWIPEGVRARLGDLNRLHYEAIRRGIMAVDAVVIEVSFQDIQIGYEAALAVVSKKPVLCLSIFEDFSQKIDNRYFFGAKYSELNVEEIVAEFVQMAKKKRLGERFNMFLSKAQETYLEKRAKDEGITRSEFLRQLIERDRAGSKNG